MMMRMERYHRPGTEYPWRCRPICHAVLWVEMVKWCAAHIPDSMADATWFQFRTEAEAEAFFARWEPECIEMDQQPAGPHRIWRDDP